MKAIKQNNATHNTEKVEKCPKTNVNTVAPYMSHKYIQPKASAPHDMEELIILRRCAGVQA